MLRITLENISYEEYLQWIEEKDLPPMGAEKVIDNNLSLINLTSSNIHFGNDNVWSLVLNIVADIPIAIGVNLLSSYLFDKFKKLKNQSKDAKVKINGDVIKDTNDKKELEKVIEEHYNEF